MLRRWEQGERDHLSTRPLGVCLEGGGKGDHCTRAGRLKLDLDAIHLEHPLYPQILSGAEGLRFKVSCHGLYIRSLLNVVKRSKLRPTTNILYK